MLPVLAVVKRPRAKQVTDSTGFAIDAAIGFAIAGGAALLWLDNQTKFKQRKTKFSQENAGRDEEWMTEEEANKESQELSLRDSRILMSGYINSSASKMSKQETEEQVRLFLKKCKEADWRNALNPALLQSLKEEAESRIDLMAAEATAEEARQSGELTEKMGLIAQLLRQWIAARQLDETGNNSSTLERNHSDDTWLTLKLLSACKEASRHVEKKNKAYIYLKSWSLKDLTWYKIGVTSNPARRDAEQNVLPVPAVTLALIEVESFEKALAIEQSLHKALNTMKIVGAGNRELFGLDDRQASSVITAMHQLSHLSTPL